MSLLENFDLHSHYLLGHDHGDVHHGDHDGDRECDRGKDHGKSSAEDPSVHRYEFDVDDWADHQKDESRGQRKLWETCGDECVSL
mgnify:CR=1 FL=1